MCSQINHFPEDADFDHDGAEYVLRKSLPASPGMNNVVDEERKKATTAVRYF